MKELRALTPEELARVEARLLNPPPGSRIEAARNMGVDLTLILEQLRLSPAERVERMLQYSAAVEALKGRARRSAEP